MSRERTSGLLGVVAFGSFLSALTSSVIGLALPDIAREFAIDPGHAAWVLLAFLLTVTVLLLPAGRLGDLLGHGRMYLVGLAIVGLGSLGCGLAGSTPVLVTSRIIQAAGASLVMATAPALASLGVPAARRGHALGLMSTGTYLGLAAGPPIGGVLIAWLGWRSIFWASLGAALITMGIGLRVLPLRRPETSGVRFDVPGAGLIAVSLLALLLLLTQAHRWGLTSLVAMVCLGVWVVALGAFLRVEARHPAPMLDLGLFRSAVFSTATLSALFNYVAIFIALFALPFALRDGQHLSPQEAGRVLATQAVAMALTVWGSGSLSDRIGSRGLAMGGMLVLTLGLGGLAASWPTQGQITPSVWLFVCGAGTGVFISPNSNALMGSAPRDRQGIAGGVMGLARNLGMSLGTALASGLLAAAYVSGSWSSAADSAVRTGLLIGAGTALVAALLAITQSSPSRTSATSSSPK